jgi:hypothetical protein
LPGSVATLILLKNPRFGDIAKSQPLTLRHLGKAVCGEPGFFSRIKFVMRGTFLNILQIVLPKRTACDKKTRLGRATCAQPESSVVYVIHEVPLSV